MNEKVRHGYYNPHQESMYGSWERRTPSGELVITTEVRETRDDTELRSKNTVYVGEVTSPAVRRVRKEAFVIDCDDIDAEREHVPDGCKCHTIHYDCSACKAVQLIRSSKGCQVHRGFNSRYTEPVQCRVCLAVKKRDGLFYILLLLPCNVTSGSLREPKNPRKRDCPNWLAEPKVFSWVLQR